METFRAPAPPLSRRLAGSGAFLGFLLGVVIFATVYFIYHHRKAEIANFAASVMKAADSSPPTETLEIPGSEPTAQMSESAAPPEESAIVPEVPSAPPVAPVAVAVPTTTSLAPQNAAENLSKQSLDVVFLEIPQSALVVLFSGLSEAGQSGVIPDFQSRLSQIKTSKTAESVRILSERNVVLENNRAKLSHLLQNGQGRGLQVSISNRSGVPEVMSLDITIENRGMMDGAFGSQLSTQNFQGTFELADRAAAYFADVISKPAGLSTEMESELLKDPVFRVLNSPGFTQRQTSFFIFFENSVTGSN